MPWPGDHGAIRAAASLGLKPHQWAVLGHAGHRLVHGIQVSEMDTTHAGQIDCDRERFRRLGTSSACLINSTKMLLAPASHIAWPCAVR